MSDPVRVRVESLDRRPEGEKVRAIAWVRIEAGPLSLVTGPWRVVKRTGFGPDRPRVFGPSARLYGAWVDVLRLDGATFTAATDAIIEEYARARLSRRNALSETDSESRAGA